MTCLKLVEALAVRIELAGNFASMVFPFLGRSEADTESGVVLGVVEIYYLSENGLFQSQSMLDDRGMTEPREFRSVELASIQNGCFGAEFEVQSCQLPRDRDKCPRICLP